MNGSKRYGAGSKPDAVDSVPTCQQRPAFVLAERLRAEEQPRVEVSKEVGGNGGTCR